MNAGLTDHAVESRPTPWAIATLLCIGTLGACAIGDTPDPDGILFRSEDALRQAGYVWISPAGSTSASDWAAADTQCRTEIKAGMTDQVPLSSIPRGQVDACLKARGWTLARPKK